jgi:hypothetical protein
MRCPAQDAIAAEPALASVSDDVDALLDAYTALSGSVDALGLALSYSTFHPVRHSGACGWVPCS